MSPDVLSSRALNRATLARQLLLERSDVDPMAAVQHLVGVQAQLPQNPYVGLWSRLRAFDPETVSGMVRERTLVRAVVMRGTLHLMTADDCLQLRSLMQPVLDDERKHHSEFAPSLVGVDLDPVIAFGRALLSQEALSGTELRAAMHERFPDEDAGALAFACRSGLELVQVPPRGEWGRSAQVRSMTAQALLGRTLETPLSIDDVVLRYLAAFGPASSGDVGAWCRLRGMAEVTERLRPRLRVFRDERGRELFDLPDGTLPNPGVPAPVRFLPEYDNLWLSYDDRARVISEDDARGMTLIASPMRGSVLIDGWLRGAWHLERERKSGEATVVVRPTRRLSKRITSSVSAEGRRLLRMIASDVEGAVQVHPPE